MSQSRSIKKTTAKKRAVFQANPQKQIIKRKVHQSLPTHKRFMLHPVSIFMLLCITVFVGGWSYEAVAESYTVTAEVPAAPLTEGATIISPSDGTSVTNASILVSGTCPSGAYVKLYTNNTFSGVTFCQNDGTFSIDDDLYAGLDNLVAEDFNVTNQQGPVTPGVTVTYTPPIQPSPPAGSGSSSSSTTTPTSSSTSTTETSTTSSQSSAASTTPPPLLLTSNYQYNTSPVSSNFTWKLDLEGGTPPYYLTIKWGDGTVSHLVFDTDPIFEISHHYSMQGYYAINVQAVDKTGRLRFMQLAARIVTPNTTGNISTINTGYSLPIINQNTTTLFFTNTKSWLWLAWPSLLVVLTMVTSFWLGEREEVRRLYQKRRLRN